MQVETLQQESRNGAPLVWAWPFKLYHPCDSLGRLPADWLWFRATHLPPLLFYIDFLSLLGFFGSWLCAMPCVISHLKYKRSWHWNLLKNSGCTAISICTDSFQILKWGKDWMVPIVFGCHLLTSFHLWSWPLNSGIAVSQFTSCRSRHNILMKCIIWINWMFCVSLDSSGFISSEGYCVTAILHPSAFVLFSVLMRVPWD